MSRDRNPNRHSEPSTSGTNGRSDYRHSPEFGDKQGRQPDENYNRQHPDRDDGHNDDNRDHQRDNSPVDLNTKGGQSKGQRARGRWKDAGEDQLRIERRQARLDRMKKVMRLFEDSLLVDKVALKDRKELANDVRERLEELKREHAERMKEQVTTHWSKLTQEGRESRARGEDDDRHPRPARSGQLYQREKSRIMSGNATHKGRGDQFRDESPDRNDDESPKRTNQRAGKSGQINNRDKNRFNSGNEAQRQRGNRSDNSPEKIRRDNDDRDRPKGDNRDDRDRRHDDPGRTGRNDGPRRSNPRGQDSGHVTNRRKNRLDSGEPRR